MEKILQIKVELDSAFWDRIYPIGIILLLFGIDSFKNIRVSDGVYDVSKLCIKITRDFSDSLQLTRLEFIGGLPTFSIWSA